MMGNEAMKASPAYLLLRELGMRPAIARHFLIGLRKKGFVIVEEATVTKAGQINEKLKIIIALMKRQRSRK